jgi:Leucine-rich repeat (LRR) protein
MLRELVLHGNALNNLSALPALPALRTLSLAGNCLAALDAAALSRVPGMTALDVARNRLDFPGRALQTALAAGGCGALRTLSIAGNPVGSLRDVARLAGLPSLEELTWRSALWGVAPAAQLPRAVPAALAALAPALRRLDGEPADGAAATKALEALEKVQSKPASCESCSVSDISLQRKVFFSMRAKTLRRGVDDVAAAAEAQANAYIATKHAEAAMLHRRRCDLELVLLASAARGDGEGALADARAQVAEAEAGASAATSAATSARHALAAAADAADRATEAAVARLMVECDTAGNVRFEDAELTGSSSVCSPTSSLPRVPGRDAPPRAWRAFGGALLGRRLAAAVDVGDATCDGARLLRVTAARSAHLGAAFGAAHAAVANALRCAARAAAPAAYGESSESDSESEDEEDEEEESDEDEEVDTSSEASASASSGSEAGDGPPVEAEDTDGRSFGGGLRAAPVFLWLGGDSASLERIAEEGFARAAPATLHSCPAQANASASASSGTTTTTLLLVRVCPGVARPVALPGERPAQGCDAAIWRDPEAPHASIWTCFTPALLLPEAIFELQYTGAGDAAADDVAHAMETLLQDDAAANALVAAPPQARALARAFAPLLALPPSSQLPPLPPLAAESAALPSEASLLLRSGMPSGMPLSALTRLSLHCAGLAALAPLRLGATCPALTWLAAPFNHLTALEGLEGLMRLATLVVSDNARLARLDGGALASLPSLRRLEAARCALYRLEDVATLRGLHLHALDLSGCALAASPAYDSLVLRRLPDLAWLDGCSVTADAVRAAAIASTTLTPAAARLAAQRRGGGPPLPLGAPDAASDGGVHPAWGADVARLALRGAGLRRLGGAATLGRMPSMVTLNLARNELGRLDGLASCVASLRELDVSATSLPGLEALSLEARCALTALHAGHNPGLRLAAAPLRRLACLTLLSLERCGLTSVAALAGDATSPSPPAPALREVYLAGNVLAALRDVAPLSSLPALLVLDLAGNPLAGTTSEYRLRVAHALPRLRCLDGEPLARAEAQAARAAFHGVLTSELLAAVIAQRHGGAATSSGADGLAPQLPPPSRRRRRTSAAAMDETFYAVAPARDLSPDRGGNAADALPALRVLDLSRLGLRDLGGGARPGGPLAVAPLRTALRSLSLEGSAALRDLSPLAPLPALAVLCAAGCGLGDAPLAGPDNEAEGSPLTPPFAALEALDLSRCGGITSAPALQLGRLRALRRLSLAKCGLTAWSGFDALPLLRELDLDGNRLRQLPPRCLAALPSLRALRLRDNGLRDVASLTPGNRLHALLLAGNRIADAATAATSFAMLPQLRVLEMARNPAERQPSYRTVLIEALPALLTLDHRHTPSGAAEAAMMAPVQLPVQAVQSVQPVAVTPRAEAPAGALDAVAKPAVRRTAIAPRATQAAPPQAPTAASLAARRAGGGVAAAPFSLTSLSLPPLSDADVIAAHVPAREAMPFARDAALALRESGGTGLPGSFPYVAPVPIAAAAGGAASPPRRAAPRAAAVGAALPQAPLAAPPAAAARHASPPGKAARAPPAAQRRPPPQPDADALGFAGLSISGRAAPKAPAKR